MSRLVGLACLAFALAGGGAAQAAPNVLLVIADDQRADTLDAMPTVLAEIGAKGAVYPESFVVNPNCCPSRIATFTGLYSHSTGFYRQNSASRVVSLAFSSVPQLAGWLDTAGYQTALVGKYLNGYDGSFVVPGWDRFVTMLHPMTYYGYTLYSDGVLTEHGSEPEDYATDVFAAEAETFVRDANPDHPLFLVFAPNAPHGTAIVGAPPVPAPRHPITPVIHDPPSLGEDLTDKPAWVRRLAGTPPPYDPAEFLSAMRATLRGVDEAVGRLLTALEDTGRLEDTLVIYTSDNGLMLGEHGLGIRKLTPHEESIRVPLAVRWDGHPFTPRMAANIDIAPTIMEAAGLPFTGDGRSLLSSKRSELLVEHFGVNVPTYCALRTATEKYVVYKDGSQELYNLTADPFELTNVTNRERRYDLRQRLARLVPPRAAQVHVAEHLHEAGQRSAERPARDRPVRRGLRDARERLDRRPRRAPRRRLLRAGPGHGPHRPPRRAAPGLRAPHPHTRFRLAHGPTQKALRVAPSPASRASRTSPTSRSRRR